MSVLQDDHSGLRLQNVSIVRLQGLLESFYINSPCTFLLALLHSSCMARRPGGTSTNVWQTLRTSNWHTLYILLPSLAKLCLANRWRKQVRVNEKGYLNTTVTLHWIQNHNKNVNNNTNWKKEGNRGVAATLKGPTKSPKHHHFFVIVLFFLES